MSATTSPIQDRRIAERRDRRRILGVNVHALSLADAVTLLDEEQSQQRCLKLAFANAHLLNLAARNGELRGALDSFVVFNDGIGLDIASRVLYGREFEDNLNGTDFVEQLLARTIHVRRIFLLGGKEGVAREAGEYLARRHPRHTIAGVLDGYGGMADTQATIAAIRASGADTLLVALGNPLQEIWLHKHLEATGCGVGAGVGALFDFMAGRVPRAPQWMRNARLEWIYRLSKEPGRLWQRYLIGNVTFLWRVGGQRLTPANSAADTPDRRNAA